MKKPIRTSLFIQSVLAIVLCISSLSLCEPAIAGSKAEELKQKIADIALLYQQLDDRTQQALSIRNALSEQQHLLSSEVHLLSKNLQVDTLKEAQEHLRLRYNVELLRTILTYMDELENKLNLYQTGRDRLNYLRQLVEDDIKMIATLNDLKIDALTTQISLVINHYLPEAHVIQIDPQQLALLSATDVWHRVMADR